MHATYPEAAAVAGRLSRPQVEALAAYVMRLQERLPDFEGLRDYLRRHRSQIGPCPFLDERGFCGIYQVRPLSCRALLSTRPAEWCSVDFSELDHWDKISYESGLDKAVVAWPTHYVAATQDYAATLENSLLLSMKERLGWSLSGHFAAMVGKHVHELYLSGGVCCYDCVADAV